MVYGLYRLLKSIGIRRLVSANIGKVGWEMVRNVRGWVGSSEAHQSINAQLAP